MREWLLILISTLSFSISVRAQVVTVVIDPGHGGKDVGHETPYNNYLDEKDLNLKIANFLGSYIEKYLQNVKVIYTRTNDDFVSLDDRVEIANHSNADFFISIHCNGNNRKGVRGTETHVHSMKVHKAVALGHEIENQFSKRAGRKSRGVKDKADLKHSLQVLKYTNMTSVLVESGFITNLKEANFLNTKYGQEIIASAIFRGFRTHIQKAYPTAAFVRDEPLNGSNTKQTKFTIQIMSSIDPVDVKSGNFHKLPGTITRRKLDTKSNYKYIYTTGSFDSRSAAKEALPKVKLGGFEDAIIIKQ